MGRIGNHGACNENTAPQCRVGNAPGLEMIRRRQTLVRPISVSSHLQPTRAPKGAAAQRGAGKPGVLDVDTMSEKLCAAKLSQGKRHSAERRLRQFRMYGSGIWNPINGDPAQPPG